MAKMAMPTHTESLPKLSRLAVDAKIGYCASASCTSEPMNRHENEVFENQHVILDEGVYVNCRFKNCSLEYSGGDVYVQNCQGEGCQLVWRGAAQRTVLLLQGLGLMVPPAPPPGTDAASRVQ